MSNSETTAQTDRAATLRAIADSGLPMPREVNFDSRPFSVTLTLDSLQHLREWSYEASARTIVHRERGKNELLFTWSVGKWQGWELHPYVFEPAPAVTA